MVAFSSVLISAVVGVVLGLMSGYFGGWIDNVIGRVFDVLFSFPALLLAIGVAAPTELLRVPGVNLGFEIVK